MYPYGFVCSWVPATMWAAPFLSGPWFPEPRLNTPRWYRSIVMVAYPPRVPMSNPTMVPRSSANAPRGGHAERSATSTPRPFPDRAARAGQPRRPVPAEVVEPRDVQPVQVFGLPDLGAREPLR